MSSDWNAYFDGQAGGSYPVEDLIRFVARNFYVREDRSAVRILEIGFGAGPNMWFLAREGFLTFGVDISDNAKEMTDKRLEGEGLKATLSVGDVVSLSYEDNYFDAVVDDNCLSALNEKDARIAIAEAHRVLRPGGIFYSRTVADGTTFLGERIPGDETTYKLTDSPVMGRRFGTHRLAREQDIDVLHNMFETVQFERQSTTVQARKSVLAQWLVTCRKADELK